MCGICGKVSLDESGGAYGPLVRVMADRLTHRGPDDVGLYSDRHAALGHRRLSIIDLSTGKQPIFNEDGTVCIVFNGEIYNYRDLRKHLIGRGHRFATSTDTEVIVHLYEEYGDECVKKLDGMFAFAIWDRNRRRLFMARDRVGIKPLYYVATAKHILFASEIKALLADPTCPREIDLSTIDRFVTFHYSPGRETLLRGVFKLEPGHYLVAERGTWSSHRYWDLTFPIEPYDLSFGEAKERLADLLDKTVKSHMISDVPVGVLLSGGVDSSGVLSYAADHVNGVLHSFTVGFDDNPDIDERPFARIAAQQVGSYHHEIAIGANEFREFLPKYVWHMEEPVCEPPAVALYYVTKFARSQGVKVLLSGEGGDEAFAGYNTYRNLLLVEQLRAFAPPFPQIISMLAGMAGALIGGQALTRLAAAIRLPLEERYFSRSGGPGSYFGRMRDELYTAEFKSAVNSSGYDLRPIFAKTKDASPLSQMLYVDTTTWLPDDLLIKADKITMANSIELRVPLLDHHLLEFAAGLPDKYKVRGLHTKRILKEALSRRIPKQLLDRKKAGFPVPVARWLRTQLFEFVNDILTDTRTRERGYFSDRGIARIIDSHQSDGNRSAELFSLLVLELWHREFVDPPAITSQACIVAST